MSGFLEWAAKEENYVCPLLSPECGDAGLNNEGCQYGRICYGKVEGGDAGVKS